MKLGDAALVLLFLFLAKFYLTEMNYYVRVQMTELALFLMVGLMIKELSDTRGSPKPSR